MKEIRKLIPVTIILGLLIAITVWMLVSCAPKTKRIDEFTFENGETVSVFWNQELEFVFQKTDDNSFVIIRPEGELGMTIAKGSFIHADVDGWSQLLSDIGHSDAQILRRGERDHAEFLYVQDDEYDYSYMYYWQIPNTQTGVALSAKTDYDLDIAVGLLDLRISEDQ